MAFNTKKRRDACIDDLWDKFRERSTLSEFRDIQITAVNINPYCSQCTVLLANACPTGLLIRQCIEMSVTFIPLDLFHFRHQLGTHYLSDFFFGGGGRFRTTTKSDYELRHVYRSVRPHTKLISNWTKFYIIRYWDIYIYFKSAGKYKLSLNLLTLRLLMSYIYGAPSKARNANIGYIYMDLRLATLKQSLSICCTMFQH